MKRTIFLNGRRRTLRALLVGAAVAVLSVPVAQAQIADASDRAKNDVKVVNLAPGFAHDMDDSVICNESGCLPRTDVLATNAVGKTAVQSEPVVDYGPLKTHGGPILPLEDRKAIEESANASAYHRADDFAPPRDLTASSAQSASGVDWSETVMWLAVGLAGALGLLGAVLLASRSRVRMAQS